jgi:hypothetical protein
VATSPGPKDFWPPLPTLPFWPGEQLVNRWINLPNTGLLRNTLLTRMKSLPQVVE